MLDVVQCADTHVQSNPSHGIMWVWTGLLIMN